MFTNYQPAVSVIIPVYNALPYLTEALESVKNQSLTNIEIVCLNDGSTDGSLEVLNKYAEMDQRFVVIDKPNEGYGMTMNRGIEVARGRYVAILEPDDYVDTRMYEVLLGVADALNVDIVRSQATLFYGDKDFRKFSAPSPIGGEPGARLSLKNDSIPTGPLFQTWTALYKRELIGSLRPAYHTTPGAMFQDSGFWFKAYASAESYAYVNQPFYYYRRDNASSSTSVLKQSSKKARGIIDEFRLTFSDLLRIEPEVPRAVANIYWLQFCQACYSAMWLAEDNDSRRDLLRLAKTVISESLNSKLSFRTAATPARVLCNMIVLAPRAFISLSRIISTLRNSKERMKVGNAKRN
ncbi:glycosyltransferase [Collinsella sp. An307]|uniref:glycosyltransferase n=1 Tax=Collinsella sp. An307 TaxID=1965630 RepID=UPI000B3A0D67|nr:glycosyltransferase [Collinsella sp. An307]OUO21808.1 hypothetical protein B5F89_02910 [Collinsella sp. An307]